jgi:hypothetical protein
MLIHPAIVAGLLKLVFEPVIFTFVNEKQVYHHRFFNFNLKKPTFVKTDIK